MIRQPIVVLVGHIDHGKSSILEKIKGLSITRGEAGGITQSIKSYNVTIEEIKGIAGSLLGQLKTDITIPGMLFLDSPGHAAFNNMRRLGGNLADLAILVVDMNEGVMEQTLECIEILREYKTPFVVALNKLDLVPGWREPPAPMSLLQALKSQSERVQEYVDLKVYEVVGRLAEKGLNAERFDRVTDYTKQVAMVPVSAKTMRGFPELLMMLTGLAQKFLKESLHTSEDGEGKATILEVKEDPGMGVTMDVILYEGKMHVNDQVVIGTLDKPIVTKIRGLFEQEGKKLVPVSEVHAAYGVRVYAPNVDHVLASMPLVVANEGVEEKEKEVRQEVENILVETDEDGVVVKADTLGSLEALTKLLRHQSVKIRKASIGNVTKKDLVDASSESDVTKRVILGFNVKSELVDARVKVITHEVIYRLIEGYAKWKEDLVKQEKAEKLKSLVMPCKVKILQGCVFRQNNPAVVGVQVVMGKVKTNIPLMKKGCEKAGYVKSMQLDGETIEEAVDGQEVAISIPGVTVGRQIKEEDVLFSDLSEEQFKELKAVKKLLKASEMDVLKEIVTMKRQQNPSWGL